MSFNNIINIFLNNDIYDKVQSGFEYLLMMFDNIFFNNLYNINCKKTKEPNYIFKLPKSNYIYRIKDRNDLIDNGPIEI
jgi:hypothetical protein